MSCKIRKKRIIELICVQYDSIVIMGIIERGVIIMLIMFRIKNFASFKDEVILDLRAVSYKDMKSHVIQLKDNKILKTLAIYGKNASGKSNLVSALYFFESFIFNQFFDAGSREDDIGKIKRMPDISRTSFKLNENIDKESEFEIIFNHKDTIYQYGFSVKDDVEDSNYTIGSEWLLVNDKDVFDRVENKLSFGKRYEKELGKIDKVRKDRLYIGTLDYFADGDVKDIVDGFKEYLKKSFNVHFEVIIESSIKGMISGVTISKRLIEDEEYRKTIENFIKVADVGISGLKIEPVENEKGEKRYEIKTLHDVYNDNDEVVRTEEFDIRLESSGTIRYFSFIQYILNMMDNGGVFIVDEISARLHPILTKFIVDLYQSEKNTKAQLIFTTHDISLMNRKQFRRDEIAFVDKNRRGESSIYTLADIKARSDASFSKDYLYGKYGAIPVIREDKVDESGMDGEWTWED